MRTRNGKMAGLVLSWEKNSCTTYGKKHSCERGVYTIEKSVNWLDIPSIKMKVYGKKVSLSFKGAHSGREPTINLL